MPLELNLMGPGFVWRGPWDTAETYDPLDAVEFAGSSYVCTVAADANDDDPATATDHWDLLAQEGGSGPAFANLDGGIASSVYGGIDPIDADEGA